jgi:hypothetical protein
MAESSEEVSWHFRKENPDNPIVFFGGSLGRGKVLDCSSSLFT